MEYEQPLRILFDFDKHQLTKTKTEYKYKSTLRSLYFRFQKLTPKPLFALFIQRNPPLFFWLPSRKFLLFYS